MREARSIRIIDTFSGCGGMTWGFVHLSKGPFTPVWANDINRHAAQSYNANFGENCVVGDINDLLEDPALQLPVADLVIGGPPCQGFSLLNRNRDGDPRKYLWKPFLEVVRRSGASVFVMENVPQLLASDEYGQIVEESESLGFKITSAMLCAADYGVPQTRSRALVVGCKFTDPGRYFPSKKTHFNPNNGFAKNPLSSAYIDYPMPWLDVRSAIGDLPAPQGTVINGTPAPLDLHFGRTPTATSMDRYRAIPE